MELLFQFQFPPGNYCQCTKMWSYPWQMWPFPISLRQSLSQVQYLWISQCVFCSRSDHHKWEGGPCSDGDAAQEGGLHSHPVKVQQVNVTKPYYHWNTALSLEAETTWLDWQAVARLALKSKWGAEKTSRISCQHKTLLVQVLIPKLPAAFVGTGDLFTALSTAWLARLLWIVVDIKASELETWSSRMKLNAAGLEGTWRAAWRRPLVQCR